MFVKAIKSFSHVKLGHFPKDVARDIPEDEAKYFLRKGWVNPAAPYETKVITAKPVDPFEAGGEEVQLSASPAAPASPKQTLKPSDSGKKRGRPKKGE